MTILTGDCREEMPWHAPFDMILADPPYGDTSLAWDRRVEGWIALARAALRPTGSLWVFGSLRCFMATADRFTDAGLRIAQEIVWEKQNGTGFHADRFKRVHELAVQFHPADRAWRAAPDAFHHLPAQLPRSGDPSHRKALGAAGDPDPHKLPRGRAGRRLVRWVRRCRRSLPVFRPALSRLRDRPRHGRVRAGAHRHRAAIP